MSTVDEVKARLDIVDLISETVELRRSGKNYTGFCPFHHNTRTPAFVVFPETQTWRCFGQCNEGGDLVKFVMKKEGWDFIDALRHLAERAGVQLRVPTPQEAAEEEEHARLCALLEEAVTFYRHQLLNTPPGQETLEYLHRRGLSDETIEVFGLGYAPDSWDATQKYFLEKDNSAEDLDAAGLVYARDSGGYNDRFRHRLMIPIRDGRGRMAGFGARALRDEQLAKYINSPQTPLFDKSNLLYGLDRARKAIRTEDQAVVVEGYMDVIALHQAGYRNAISPMGTALTEGQLRQIKRLTRRIVLALDADAAGNQATLRGLQVAREALDREVDRVFDARGLLRHESRLQADIRVTTLPADVDPDEIVNQNPEQWAQILKDAHPIVAHVMQTLAEGQDLDDPKVKREISGQVLPLIRDLPSAIERDTYIQQLARLLRVDERSLLSERTPTGRRRRISRRAPTPPLAPEETAATRPSAVGTSTQKLEAHCLSILMRRPELLYRVDRALQEAGLARLSTDDFQNTDHQEMLRITRESLNQDHIEPQSFTLENLPLPLLDSADAILVNSKELDPNEERVLDDLMRAILMLRRTNLQQNNQQLRFLQEEAQEKEDARGDEYQKAIQANLKVLGHLDKAIGRFTERTLTTSIS